MASNHNKKQKRWAKVMAWVLAILMMSSVATVLVSLLVTLLAK